MNFKKPKDKLTIRPKKTKESLAVRKPYDIWTDMDNLFDQFRTNLDHIFWNPYWELGEIHVEKNTPPMDIVDLDDKYEIKLDIPGIPKEDINIEVTQFGLEISADYQKKNEEKGTNWIRRERQSQKFFRCFDLPDEIKSDKVEAELKEGVLTLSIPKKKPKPKYKSTKIKIK